MLTKNETDKGFCPTKKVKELRQKIGILICMWCIKKPISKLTHDYHTVPCMRRQERLEGKLIYQVEVGDKIHFKPKLYVEIFSTFYPAWKSCWLVQLDFPTFPPSSVQACQVSFPTSWWHYKLHWASSTILQYSRQLIVWQYGREKPRTNAFWKLACVFCFGNESVGLLSPNTDTRRSW